MLNIKSLLAAAGLAAGLASSAQAGQITFTNWISSDSDVANYSLSIDDNTAGYFNYSVSVNPWNAEAIGLFFDLGNLDLAGNPFSDPSVLELSGSDVALFSYDTPSPNCGASCALSSTLEAATQAELNNFDSEWELVFRLGDSGFDGIQTFNFTTTDFNLSLDAFEMAAIRSNQFCHGDDLLPTDENACYWGDKVYSVDQAQVTVSEPGAFALLTLALAISGFARSRKA